MGCCNSCFGGSHDGGEGLFDDIELEIRDPNMGIELDAALNVTATTLTLTQPNNELKGKDGYACAPTQIEQDSCYFEIHVEKCLSSTTRLKFGLTTLLPISRMHKLHQEYCHEVLVSEGDVYGCAVNFDDLPMLRFYRNGGPVPLHDFSKVRGELYPLLALNPVKGQREGLEQGGFMDDEDSVVKFVFDEKCFKKKPKLIKFGPLMASRGLM
ncbi:hypothetical protein ScalyP_jg1516 [Parmales sp. scaly parma]|nr:hypothetical protein ScalyP_jg1516 [Parmales sp. scaly parma]